MTTLPEKQALTVKEVAATFGLGVSTIWRQVREGTFPPPIRIGGCTRWRKADIDALLAREAL